MEASEKCIAVTHFINPQRFWYHSLNVPNAQFNEVIQIEDELADLGKYQAKQQHYRPQVGDKVSVNFLAWNKFIRAQVQDLVEFSGNHCVQYIVWALDYGFPFQTKQEHVRRLPSQFGHHIDHMRCGGLSQVVPAEKEFDFMEKCAIMTKHTNWNQRACDMLEKLLTDAASITFVEQFQTPDNQFWGDLIIVNHKNEKYQVRDYLVAINFALDSGPNFREQCLTLGAITILPWLSNNGNNKYKTNTLNSTVSSTLNATIDLSRCNIVDDNSYKDSAKRKVEDWHARNAECSALMPIESSAESSAGDFDEISFNDSVSNKNLALRKMPQRPYSDSVSGSLASVGCSGGGSVRSKYSDKQFPPKPSFMAFKINPIEKSSTETVSSVLGPSHSQNLSEDALVALEKNRHFRSPTPSQALKTNDAVSSVTALTTPPNSVMGMSAHKRKLLEVRNKLTCQQTQSPSPSTVGSDASTPTYEHLQESTSQAESPPTDKTRNVLNSDKASTCSEQSYRSSRSKQLQELRQRLVKTKSAEKKKEEVISVKPAEKPKQLVPKPSNISARIDRDEDTSSIISTVSTTQAKFLMSLRKKFQDQNNNPSKPKDIITDKEPTVNKVTIEPTSPSFEFPDFAAISKSSARTHKTDVDLLPMVPAGFDLTRLVRYKDEENHWHHKKTTRFDHIPHDLNTSTAEEQLLNTSKTSGSSSSDQWNPHSNRDGNNDNRSSLTLCNANRAKEQNFRLTRSHTDKYKEGNPVNAAAERHLLDTTVPYINEKAMNPCVEQKREKNTDATSDQVNFSTHHTDTSSSSASTSRLKRRQLKQPAQQMSKMEQIIRRANLEQQIGNPHILDLSKLNTSGSNKTDSDSFAEALSADDGSGSASEDKNVLPKSSQLSKNQSPPTQRTEAKPLTSEQIKLERLAQNLNFELSLRQQQKPTTTMVLSQPQQLREIGGEAHLQTKFIEHLVLAHSKVPLQPLERISDAFFLQEIHDEMVNMHLTKVYRIQAYSWSHLLRGNSLFVVNPKRSGKTFCYLPPICSLVGYRTPTLPSTYGPVAIILVPSSTHVEAVDRDCRRLLARIKDPIVVVPSFGIRNANDAKIQLLNSCGILVATPANLLRLLHDNENESLINPDRLHHLVIDDMHLMLSRSKSDLEAVLRAVIKLCKKSTANKLALQLVVTSRDWDPLMIGMMRHSNQPLLLIGDFLEAAVYGKAELSIKLKSHKQKINTVIRFIEQHPLDLERLLIFCNCDEDVDEVVQALTSSGYACIAYSSRMSAVVRATVEEWKLKVLCSQILVCTDASFLELQIQNVQNLIHYSMPTMWTKFTYRFSSMAKTYENFVVVDFKSTSVTKSTTSKPVASTLILLDEDNSMQLPRLMTFMKKHNQLPHIPPDILAVSKRVQVQREQELIEKGTPMCPYVLEFGECDEQSCYFRHNFTPVDTVTKADGIPTSGDMRILILRVVSPTHYTARLLQHKAPNSNKWNQLRRSNDAAVFGMQLNLHYSNPEHLILHWPPKNNDLCIYKVAHNFQRARIIEVATLKQGVGFSVVQKIKVSVHLIDVGKVCDVKSDELFICDASFKGFPAQAIDIRVVGLVPFDNERTWDSNATRAVQKWIMSGIKKSECVNASINFALSNTIFVSNVIVMEQLPTVGQYIYRINLRRSLVEKRFALFSSTERKSVRDIAEELDLLQLDYESEQETETDFESCNNDSNLVKFSLNESEESPVTAAKLEAQKNDKIADQLNVNLDDSFEKVEENWDNLCDKNVRGDDEIYLPLEPKSQNQTENVVATTTTSKPSTTSSLNHEEWCLLPLHQVVKIEIGDENENGNWKDIYVQIIDNLHTQEFEQLSDIINEHVETLKQEEQEPLDETWFQPMRNCIVKYDERYLRAKLYKVYGSVECERIYRFYLCDYACFETIKADEIHNDRVYASTKEITGFTPYQSIHCTLAGIQLDQFAKRYQVTKSYLYGYAVTLRENVFRPGSTTTLALKGINIKSYEILLYESDTENDISTAVMLNKALVENGVAAVNPNTKHFLELETPSVDLSNFDVTGAEEMLDKTDDNPRVLDFREFLECYQRQVKLDYEEKWSSDKVQKLPKEAKIVDKYAHQEALDAKRTKKLREALANCAVAMEQYKLRTDAEIQERENVDALAKTSNETNESKDSEEKQQEHKDLPLVTIDETKESNDHEGKQKKPKRWESYAAEETHNLSESCNNAVQATAASINAASKKPTRNICGESDEELLISSSASDTNSVSVSSSVSPSSTSDSKIYTPAPPLTVQHKRPQTTWYETDFHIYLSIHAPDINEYYLKVTADTLIFAAEIQGFQQALFLNFLGTVESSCVSHELRGLNVVVRLVKSIFGKWPRLLEQPTKFPWLTYNFNAIDTNEIEHLLPQQRLHLALENNAYGNNYDTDSDDDGERNLYQTYTPIVNSDDVHDPTADID